jgi:hypothetical protein
MAAPTAYTEKELAAYMHAELGPAAAALGLEVGLSDAGDYAEAVNETILQYGVTAISQASDILKLRALARVQAWRTAAAQMAALFDFGAEGGSYQRSQMAASAEKNLARALIDALPYDENYRVRPEAWNNVNYWEEIRDDLI